MRKTTGLIYRAGRKIVLQPGEALLLCRMAWWVMVLSVAAQRYSLPRALEIVAGQPSHTPAVTDPADRERLARSIDLLLSTDVWIFKPICWKRAAVLHRYLARGGTPTRIIFGVRNDPTGTVTGHAWLEAEGQPILETTPPEYVATYRFPSNERFDPQFATISLE
ncbi:MAG TPA: lasso peptide biosynthesis B2 protein [Pyrinomonadaceae bacterium]|nr:lasso peptide biosynthesis B2 protein [Pyrinomonadaceae bacterium]